MIGSGIALAGNALPAPEGSRNGSLDRGSAGSYNGNSPAATNSTDGGGRGANGTQAFIIAGVSAATMALLLVAGALWYYYFCCYRRRQQPQETDIECAAKGAVGTVGMLAPS